MYIVGQRRARRQSTSSSSSQSMSHSSQISTSYVKGVLERLMCSQTHQSTLQNYVTIWRAFNKFLLKLDKPLRTDKVSWEEKTALFGAYLVDQGNQSSTIASYFSAIKAVLKWDGYQWDEGKVLLGALIRSCKLKNSPIKG